MSGAAEGVGLHLTSSGDLRVVGACVMLGLLMLLTFGRRGPYV